MTTSELRKDLISGRWVIIASERSKRPDDFRRPVSCEQKDAQAGFCPFCGGNESKTPPEIFAMRNPGTAPDTPGWTIRVVPNKFPALTRGESPQRKIRGIFESMPGIGVHEVVIESPDHDREINDLTPAQIQDILGVYQQRIRSIETEPQYQYVQLFKNKGNEAGASLSHPHSQIVATPIVPKRVKEKIYGSERYFKRTKVCLFCRTIEEERAAGERLVMVNAHFAVNTPFASRFPFEMRIHPLRHSPFFSSAGSDELNSLAEVLKSALARLKGILSDPPYNIVLHQAPHPETSRKVWPRIDLIFHWYLEIIPVLTRIAGFEWGTGFYINPVSPEAAAKFLRG
jgi:UDPglucose--hexose-1-phosphate uridylyltransferase